MAFVSVIIPTHNRAHTLLRALESVRTQTFSNWELIVIDDGSTDGTQAVVKQWMEANETPITYLQTADLQQGESKPLGVSAARNWGARAATGEWLAFLDSDDEWLPEKLELQMGLLNEVSSTEKGTWNLIHGEEIWIRNGVRVNPMKKHAKSGGRIFSRCVELCCISPSTALVKRELFDRLGGFREDFPVCEDYELWLRICSLGEVGFVETPVIKKYGGHADQLSRKYKAMDFFRVVALVPFLSSTEISEDEREAVVSSIKSRCEILLKGVAKHGPDALERTFLRQDLQHGANPTDI